MAEKIHVIMVCLGNICRSPMAEVVLRKQVAEAGLPVRVDSAGTGDWHIGQDANINTIKVLEERGYEISHRAKQFDPKFFDQRDLVIAMDISNLNDLKRISPPSLEKDRLRLLREFDPALGHLPDPHEDLIVPDPYGGTLEEFRKVLDMVEIASTGLTKHLATRL
jgi:protein-tyrosine phosphatase